MESASSEHGLVGKNDASNWLDYDVTIDNFGYMMLVLPWHHKWCHCAFQNKLHAWYQQICVYLKIYIYIYVQTRVQADKGLIRWHSDSIIYIYIYTCRHIHIISCSVCVCVLWHLSAEKKLRCLPPKKWYTPLLKLPCSPWKSKVQVPIQIRKTTN